MASRRKSCKGLKNRIFKGPIDKCHWCNLQLSFRWATVDHLKDVSQGGTDDLVNLVIACNACNNERSKLSTRRANLINNQVLRIKLRLKIAELLRYG